MWIKTPMVLCHPMPTIWCWFSTQTPSAGICILVQQIWLGGLLLHPCRWVTLLENWKKKLKRLRGINTWRRHVALGRWLCCSCNLHSVSIPGCQSWLNKLLKMNVRKNHFVKTVRWKTIMKSWAKLLVVASLIFQQLGANQDMDCLMAAAAWMMLIQVND